MNQWTNNPQVPICARWNSGMNSWPIAICARAQFSKFHMCTFEFRRVQMAREQIYSSYSPRAQFDVWPSTCIVRHVQRCYVQFLLQVIFNWAKIDFFTSKQMKVYRWHGNSFLCNYVLSGFHFSVGNILARGTYIPRQSPSINYSLLFLWITHFLYSSNK